MSRQIIFHGNYFIDFYKELDIKVKQKIQYIFELIKQVDRVPEKFLSTMIGYEGLYEIRIEYQSNIYRVFCCFDEGKRKVDHFIEWISKKDRKNAQKGN